MIKSGLYMAQLPRIDLKDGVYLCTWVDNSISFKRGKDSITMCVNRLSPKSKPVEASLIVSKKRGLVLFEVLEA
jgi:hypothetical protein